MCSTSSRNSASTSRSTRATVAAMMAVGMVAVWPPSPPPFYYLFIELIFSYIYMNINMYIAYFNENKLQVLYNTV